MRKNFKYVALALVAMMILSTTAFAATTTTTTYDGEYITVSATVTGATGDEQVTYLVHKSTDADIADDEILYINQKPATAGEAKFDYKVAMTDAALPISTTVISGSTSGAALATDGDNIDLVNVDIDNQTGLEGIYTLTQDWLGTEDTATLTITAEGKFFVDDAEYTGPIAVEAGKTYVITKGEEEPELPVINHVDAEIGEEEGSKFVTLFATVANLPEGASFGIQFTKDGETIDCPALGKTADGEFAVKLLDNGTGLLDGEYQVQAYFFAGGEYNYPDAN